MEDILRVSLLIDFYGNLLTGKQRDVLRLHYEDDMSLGEIAAQSGISRAAVHDSLKRSLAQLDEFEEKLGLVSRFRQQATKIEELKALLKQAIDALDEVKL